MSLRNKLLSYFISLIIIALVVFGVSAYQLTHENAMERGKNELSVLVTTKNNSINQDYKKNLSLNHAFSHILDLPDDNYGWLVTNTAGEVVFPINKTSLFSENLNLFHISELINSSENNSEFILGENKFLWEKAEILGTQYYLLGILKPYDSNYHQRFSKLASRLIIIGLIITWVAVWLSLIFSSSVIKEIKYHKFVKQELNIANQILVDAKNISDNANKIKSEFLSNMSHEIRTPLTSIIGFAESNLDINQSKEERIRATKTIINNGKHLMHIINEILDLSKVEAGKLEVEISPFSTLSMLDDINQLVSIMVQDKGIKFNVNCIYPLPETIKSDQLRLKQILLNLCSNAIKFTPVGHVDLSVSYEEASSKLIFEVMDTGIGLTETQQESIFKPFEQADASTTRQYGGTGLGLTLSNQLVDLLDGELLVESKENHGSRFTVKIEIEKANSDNYIYENNIDATISNVSIQPETVIYMGKVLVAEDNLDIQDLIRLLFKRIGIVPDIVENGLLAVERALSENYDLLIMDMQMPIMDGLTAMEKLKQLNINIPVIAMTANAMKKDRERCKKAGFSSFISKPIDRNYFYSVLKKYLQLGQIIGNGDTMLTSNLLIDEPDLIDLIDKFMVRLPSMQEAINSAFSSGNTEELSGLIHQMKGVGGGYGYPMLTELCAKIEFQLTAKHAENIATLVNDFNLMAAQILDGAEENHKIAKNAELLK